MLDSGKFNLAVHSCFAEFDTNYKKVIMECIKESQKHEVIVKQLVICLSKSKYRFLKNTSDSFVSFICQDYFKKQRHLTEK